MRIKDESQWQLQRAEFAKDFDPRAEPFRKFVEGWAEAAELDYGASGISPMQSLNATLRQAETDTGGRWPVSYLGMALVLLSTHWELAGTPEDFMKDMTTIEQSLYLDILAIRMEELQTQAAEVPGDQASS